MARKITKNIESYKKLLPKRLTVKVGKSVDGELWAKIKELPNCYTQAQSFLELIEMLNDLVYTHLEIPIKHMKELGHYLPKEIVGEIKRQQYQDMIKEMMGVESLKRKSEIFELNN